MRSLFEVIKKNVALEFFRLRLGSEEEVIYTCSYREITISSIQQRNVGGRGLFKKKARRSRKTHMKCITVSQISHFAPCPNPPTRFPFILCFNIALKMNDESRQIG